MPPHRPAHVVFDENVEFEPNTGCWLWSGSLRISGYGQLAIGPRQPVGAHQYSYHVHKGPIPEGLLVLHKCDTPACVNPEHLFLGTHADNHADCVRKGRHRYGPNAPRHPKYVPKLTRLMRLIYATPFLARQATAIYQNSTWPRLED